MKLTCEEACSSLVRPIQRERMRSLKSIDEWLSDPEVSQALTFQQLTKLFGACATALYLTDGIVEQRKVSVGIVKLTRKTFDGEGAGFAALLLAVAEFWEHIDSHRVPKFLLLIRIIVAELLFQVIACDFDEIRCARLYSAFLLVNPIVRLPKNNGGIPWLTNDQVKGCAQTPAIVLHLFSVWFEEIAKQLGGRIYIAETPPPELKKLRTEGSVSPAGRRTAIRYDEFFFLCHPLFRCLAFYGQAENVWNRFHEVVENLMSSEELFGDDPSRDLCRSCISRFMEAIVAAGLVTSRNSEVVNKIRVQVANTVSPAKASLEEDVETISQWADTYRIIQFSS